MSLRALANMDHTDPGLTQVVKEVAADLKRVPSGFLCRVFSELDLRIVQEESLSVAGGRLIEAELPEPPAAAADTAQVDKAASTNTPLAPADSAAPSASDAPAAAAEPEPVKEKEEVKDKDSEGSSPRPLTLLAPVPTTLVPSCC